MKKRKVSNDSLTELAKRMPVLSEEMMSSYIGGVVYFDKDGTRLGKVGGSDLIRVTTLEDYEYAYQLPLNDSSCEEMGSPLSSLSNEVKQKVYSYYVNSYAPNASSFEFGEISNIAQCNTSKVLTLNPFASGVGNENSLISTLQHEDYHLSTLSDWKPIVDDSGVLIENPNKATNELSALEYQIAHDEFKNSSSDYRARVAESLYQTWLKLGMNKTREEAGEKCNVNYTV
ncbi:MAG: hypothetical protein PHR52_09935 [Fermentimonas sp.]|nr:hypothetical protein [Fermentimonas sp.]